MNRPDAQPAPVEAVAWGESGWSTARSDRAAVETAVDSAYRAVGLAPPVIRLWVDSPLGGALAAAGLTRLHNQMNWWFYQDESVRRWHSRSEDDWDRLVQTYGGRVWDDVWRVFTSPGRWTIWYQVGQDLAEDLPAGTRERWLRLHHSLWPQIDAQEWSRLGSPGWADFTGFYWDTPIGWAAGHLPNPMILWGRQLPALVPSYPKWGNPDWWRGRLSIREANWQHVTGQVADDLGVPGLQQLTPRWPKGRPGDFLNWELAAWQLPPWQALPRKTPPAVAAVSSHVGCWWPMQAAVVLCDRPTVVKRDQRGRLHCVAGPALAYADGWSVCVVEDFRLPCSLLAGDWGAAEILASRNVEVRRLAIEMMGWDRFAREAGLRLVHRAPDPANPPRMLELYDCPDLLGGPVRVLLMTNASPDPDGTYRQYGELVPANIDDAVGASAWAFGISRDEYLKLRRAT